MKAIHAPSHSELMTPLMKQKRYRQKIEAGVQRLKVVSQMVELREKLGLSQSALARRIGVSQPFIARLENDECSNLSLETIVKIAEALSGDVEIRIRASKKAA